MNTFEDSRTTVYMGQYLLHLCCCLPVKKEVQAMQVKEEELLFLNKMGVSLSKQYPHPKCCSVLASVGHTVCPFQNLHFNTSKLIGFGGENYLCKQQKYSKSPWTRLIHWHFLEFRFKGNWIKAKIPVKFKSSDGHTVGWVSKTEDADLIIQVITCWWFAHHYYCAICSTSSRKNPSNCCKIQRNLM